MSIRENRPHWTSSTMSLVSEFINKIGSSSKSISCVSDTIDASSVMDPLDIKWPKGIEKHRFLLTEREIRLTNLLISLDQQHLFDDWEDPGVNDDLKHEFFVQIDRLHSSYPSPGGISDYVNNARKLLASAKKGANPLEGFTPSVPTGIVIDPFSQEHLQFEKLGLEEVAKVGFVLVAGGLGERLGYSGIKVELPSETTTNTCYLELYCQSILAIQTRYGDINHQVPLAIMTSDDTFSKTVRLLESKNYFGLETSQVTIMKQEKVAALTNNMAHLARASTYEIESKPHGHGDVHALLHSTGTVQSWAEKGIKWIFFFQDTNGLAFFTLAAQLGVSLTLGLDVNSMSIPRIAKQAVGAITKLKRSDGFSITANVEYNQLDPLLRANGFHDGDVNDSTTGYSPYPGNINQLLLAIEPYMMNLASKHGIMSEFVNPKYADKEKTTFKKPTRLECMMQDYPKTLENSDKVGFTMAPAWLCFSPCKNNAVDAAAAVKQGIPANSAFTAESDQYFVFAEFLRLLGAAVISDDPKTFLGITAPIGPRIVIKPSTALFPSEFIRRFPSPSRVSISPTSTLIVEGNVEIRELHLDGAVEFLSRSNSLVVTGSKCVIHNSGHSVFHIDDENVDRKISEVDRMRGYIIAMTDGLSISPSEHSDVSSWVFNGNTVIPESALEEEPSDHETSVCGTCFPKAFF